MALTVNTNIASLNTQRNLNTSSKALAVLGEETLTDATGREHRWRDELTTAIISRQGENGSWTNPNERWLEGEPVLSTSYALLALANCLQ